MFLFLIKSEVGFYFRSGCGYHLEVFGVGVSSLKMAT